MLLPAIVYLAEEGLRAIFEDCMYDEYVNYVVYRVAVWIRLINFIN